MRHYYNNNIDIAEIAMGIKVEGNNPLLKDVMRLARLWHSDKEGARKLLSYEYDTRNNNSTILCDINYDSTGNYTIVEIAIGRGCISTDVLNAKISLVYSSILNLASTKLELWTSGSVSRNDLLGVLAKMNYEGTFKLLGEDYLELSMKNIDINQVMNYLKSIEVSTNLRQYKAVNSSW